MSPSSLSLVILGILPTVVIMAVIMISAVGKKVKPIKKLAAVFMFSVFSVLPAATAEGIGGALLQLAMGISSEGFYPDELEHYLLYQFLFYMLIVGICEEACKFFTFKLMIFHDRSFDNTYDGIIYGAASALGFATLENLIYIFSSEDSLETALMRALLSIPLHAMTGIFMGYYFGVSKYRKYNNVDSASHPEIPAYIFAVIIHGLYDYFITAYGIMDSYDTVMDTESTETLLYLAAFVAVVIVCYAVIIITIVRARKNSHNIYNRYYYEHLAGSFQDMRGGTTSDKWPAYMQNPFLYQNPYGGYRQNIPPQSGFTTYYPPPQGNVQGSVRTNVHVTPQAICPRCGAHNPPHSNFCSTCGFGFKQNV